MRLLKHWWSLALALALVTPAFATTVLQMNLNQLTANAAGIYRGTVLDIQQTTIQAGGGTLPALHYRVKVSEVFKGQVPTIKDVQIAEFKILGNVKDMNQGRALPGFPVMQSGQEYLFFVAETGPIGLTQLMGLGQGCFTFSKAGADEMVVNAFDNHGLFAGMAGSMPASGPVAYSEVSALIRAQLGN